MKTEIIASKRHSVKHWPNVLYWNLFQLDDGRSFHCCFRPRVCVCVTWIRWASRSSAWQQVLSLLNHEKKKSASNERKHTVALSGPPVPTKNGNIRRSQHKHNDTLRRRNALVCDTWSLHDVMNDQRTLLWWGSPKRMKLSRRRRCHQWFTGNVFHFDDCVFFSVFVSLVFLFDRNRTWHSRSCENETKTKQMRRLILTQKKSSISSEACDYDLSAMICLMISTLKWFSSFVSSSFHFGRD